MYTGMTYALSSVVPMPLLLSLSMIWVFLFLSRVPQLLAYSAPLFQQSFLQMYDAHLYVWSILKSAHPQWLHANKSYPLPWNSHFLN